MLWREFIEGTGCKDNDKNYEVYKMLEIAYMNSDMSKNEVYEYGKKLVDNSKTEKEIRFENQVKEEINDYKTLIDRRKKDIERYTGYLSDCLNTEDDIRWVKDSIKTYKENIKHYKRQIARLKWVLA